jgi:hypothetical protein
MRITIVLVMIVFHHVRGFKMEERAAIKFCVQLKNTATETFEVLNKAYGEECLSRTSVFECHRRFKEGRELLQDDEQKGHPSISRTEESTEVIPTCLAKDQTFVFGCWKK